MRVGPLATVAFFMGRVSRETEGKRLQERSGHLVSGLSMAAYRVAGWAQRSNEETAGIRRIDALSRLGMARGAIFRIPAPRKSGGQRRRVEMPAIFRGRSDRRMSARIDLSGVWGRPLDFIQSPNFILDKDAGGAVGLVRYSNNMSFEAGT